MTNTKNKANFNIVFMGTPDFAVESLKQLINNNFNVVGVVTSPDKPAGRGQKLSQSAVKKFALLKNLKVLQPTNLKSDDFQQELKSLQAHLQVIVAFRMLPESVWNMPPLGSINLHASLLPQYRGAAPINWAVINGEKETGITTFFLKHEIDTGDILFQKKITIEETDNAGTVHDKLMHAGAGLLVKTVQAIVDGNYHEKPQAELTKDKPLKTAPKIFKKDCKIDWTQPLEVIFNQIRGLSPYPAAWSHLKSENRKDTTLKIFDVKKVKDEHQQKPGTILTDEKTFFKVAVPFGFIVVEELQLSGKKRMRTDEFLRGFQSLGDYYLT